MEAPQGTKDPDTAEQEPSEREQIQARRAAVDTENERLLAAGDEGAQGLVEIAGSDENGRGVERLDDQEKMDALAWLLADEEEGEDTRTEKWEFNVGTEERQVWIDWVIRPIDADTMTGLRQRATARRGVNRPSRRGAPETIDNTLFNLFMVASATVLPDLAKAAEAKGVAAADPLYGPVELLKHRFRNKPGIVDQIAAKVMLFSGYDDEDARRPTPEASMVRAAGN